MLLLLLAVAQKTHQKRLKAASVASKMPPRIKPNQITRGITLKEAKDNHNETCYRKRAKRAKHSNGVHPLIP